jgi:5-oxoprolinase (ATP-hydrolysing)
MSTLGEAFWGRSVRRELISGKWQFWIDRGGTFTDIVALRPDRRIVTHKLLSEAPEAYPDAALAGIRDLLSIDRHAPIPGTEVSAVKMGTTLATNALLERKGEPVLLLITKGFGDALRIGYQNRPRLFDLHIVLPEPLYQEVLEVDERVTSQGEILRHFDPATVRPAFESAFKRGIRAVAIVFLHGYRHPSNEVVAGQLASEIGFSQISMSHKVSPLIKMVARGETTVVDAYLTPVLSRYVDRVSGDLGETRLMFMQSNGGLTDARFLQGKDGILSGPAGGVIGAVRTAERAGFKRVIGFDMGGTSTDVSHYNGTLERSFEETRVGGVRVRVPMLAIHTVAAGGGSIVTFDGARFRVGPQSAGANPGPACYRRGGPLTVTDCNVVLGRVQPAWFPSVFGPDGDQPLDVAAPRTHLAELAARVSKESGVSYSAERAAEGFLSVAVQNMANAIKSISVQRGYDVTEYVLCSFGGAGGQHACLVADALGIRQVFIHPLAGVLSAYGIGLADLTTLLERAVESPLIESGSRIAETLDRLEDEARANLLNQDAAISGIEVLRRVHMRYQGTDTALVVPENGAGELRAAFEQEHQRRFGFVVPEGELIVDSVSVEAVGISEPVDDMDDEVGSVAGPPFEVARVPLWSAGRRYDAPVFERNRLQPGQKLAGPALIVEANATTVVDAGWEARVDSRRNLLLEKIEPKGKPAAISTSVEPVMLEIFNNIFMSIAEQMGVTLANTAHSVNIKERLDFSCAIFDVQGSLVANAPHIPVHLGSMGESVRHIIDANAGRLRPGDVYGLNDPYHGGTHLPDITVVTPVFGTDGEEILFYVVSRGHHADIGGITPGSMPPRSRVLAEEGVLIDNFKLVSGGRFLEGEILDLLTSGPWPVRNPRQNILDMEAQIAANESGVQELRKLVQHFGLDVVRAYMQHVQDNAAESVRRVIDRLKDGAFICRMDDGAAVHVAVRVDRRSRSATIDFTGTSSQRETNFNAPTAVCKAAVLYVFRTLVDDEIPLNAGCLKPLEIIIPDGCMLNPKPPAAVVAGNVETSQCITDALYGALGVMAASQGTMNNFTFGNSRYQYYETICGGSGAGPDFDGTDAVQTNMTNSRLTDPEVLESRFPVLLESFAIRRRSGGAGRHKGGDGIVRKIRFREAMTAAILSGRRVVPPYGMTGGMPGALGRTWVERTDGSRIDLAGTDEIQVGPGDSITIETPGGGGWGPPTIPVRGEP